MRSAPIVCVNLRFVYLKLKAGESMIYVHYTLSGRKLKHDLFYKNCCFLSENYIIFCGRGNGRETGFGDVFMQISVATLLEGH